MRITVILTAIFLFWKIFLFLLFKVLYSFRHLQQSTINVVNKRKKMGVMIAESQLQRGKKTLTSRGFYHPDRPSVIFTQYGNDKLHQIYTRVFHHTRNETNIFFFK